MKNLLKIISAISLIGTASTSVIACENKINTIEKINNVIKNKLLGDINIGVLTIPTPQKIKFILKKQNPNLDINAIAITNITNKNCNVTGDNKSYIGTVGVNYSCSTTNKINFELNELAKNLTITNKMNGLQVLAAIRSGIISLSNEGYISNEELKSDQTLLWSAWISESDWNYEQIWSTTNLEKYNNGNIIIKINIKTDNLYFNQIINWRETKINIKTDLNTLSANIRTIDNIEINDINSFIDKLVISFSKQREFNNLKKDDIDLFKKDSIINLDKDDIVTNANLEITVEAKKDSSLFTGNKNVKVNLIVNKIDLKTKITTLTTDITADLYESYQKLIPIIDNAPEIKNLLPQLYVVNIGFYKDANAMNILDIDESQKPGNIYIIISASDNDPNYKGDTNIIMLTLK